MKTEGRPQSRNVVHKTNKTFTGRRDAFVNESLKLASENHRPTTKLGKQGTRKANTGYKTGGGF